MFYPIDRLKNFQARTIGYEHLLYQGTIYTQARTKL